MRIPTLLFPLCIPAASFAAPQVLHEIEGPLSEEWAALPGGDCDAKPWFEPVRLCVDPLGELVVELGGDELGTGSAYVRARDASTGEVVWEQGLGGADTWLWSDGAFSEDGALLYTSGRSYVSASDWEALVGCWDRGGALLWTTTVDGGGDLSSADALVVSASGRRVYTVGSVLESPFGSDVLVLALNEFGDLRWSQRVDASAGGSDSGDCIALTRDGSRLFVGGRADSTGPGGGVGTDGLASALDTDDGAVEWTYTWQAWEGPGGNHDYASVPDLAVDAGGTRVYATIDTSDFTPGVVALEAATGSLAWGREFTLPSCTPYTVGRLALAPDGASLFAIGVGAPCPSPTDADSQMVAWGVDTALGAVLWTREFAEVRGLPSRTVRVDPSGTRVALLGSADLDTDGSGILPGHQLRIVRAEDGLDAGSALFTGDAMQGFIGTQARDIGWHPTEPLLYVLDERLEVTACKHPALLAYRRASLLAEPASISVSAGGAQSLELDAAPGQAANVYLVVGSASGTSPGLPLGVVELPLVPDAYLLLSVTGANQPPFGATLGVLDEVGRAQASWTLPAGSNPALAGLVLNHAFVAFDAVGASFASEPARLTLEP